MSNVTIIFVCASVILVSWLIRRYQDKNLQPNNDDNQTPKKTFGSFLKPAKPIQLTEVLSDAFPNHVIKNKIDDKNTAFICCTNEQQSELAIIKVLSETDKKIQTMGGVVRITYGSMPTVRELQRDLSTKINKIA